MRVLITAGEASGDLYGAELTRALRERCPDVVVTGMGGPRMRRAGVTLFRDTSTWGAIGVVNALRVVPRALSAFTALRARLRRKPPDVFVPIDCGAFNVRAGYCARRLGIPVYYFIAPGSWRKTGPISPKLLQAASVFCTQLPWHAERLRAAGARAEFFGHPLLDLARPSRPAAELRRVWDLPEGDPVVGILPGSRRHEVEHLLPAFLDAGALVLRQQPRARFVLGLAEVVDRRQVARILAEHGWQAREVAGGAEASGPGGGHPSVAPADPAGANPAGAPRREVLLLSGRTYDCLAVADAALCCSGTVTLEAAILGVPQVIAYRGSFGMRVQYQLVKHRIQYVGLPNLLLGSLVCPELLDTAATPERLAAALMALLGGGPEARAQQEAAHALRNMLGQPGTIRMAAARILEIGAAEGG